MVKNAKTWISSERNLTSTKEKKSLNCASDDTFYHKLSFSTGGNL